MAAKDVLIVQEESGPQNTEKRVVPPAASFCFFDGSKNVGAVASTTVIGRGILADRPAASSSNPGFLYYATDTSSLSRSNGSGWDDCPTGIAYSDSAYIVVNPTDDPLVNGQLLSGAYEDAVFLSPNGAALSNINRATILLLPGDYDFDGDPFTVGYSYIDIVGWGSDPKDVLLSNGSTLVVDMTSSDMVLANLTIIVKSGPAVGYTESTAGAILKNIHFYCYTDTSTTYASRYEDCFSGHPDIHIFGPSDSNNTLSGTWIRCRGGTESFCGADISGRFFDCEVASSGADAHGWRHTGSNSYSFTGLCQNCRVIASGTDDASGFNVVRAAVGDLTVTTAGQFIGCSVICLGTGEAKGFGYYVAVAGDFTLTEDTSYVDCLVTSNDAAFGFGCFIDNGNGVSSYDVTANFVGCKALSSTDTGVSFVYFENLVFGNAVSVGGLIKDCTSRTAGFCYSETGGGTQRGDVSFLSIINCHGGGSGFVSGFDTVGGVVITDCSSAGTTTTGVFLSYCVSVNNSTAVRCSSRGSGAFASNCIVGSAVIEACVASGGTAVFGSVGGSSEGAYTNNSNNTNTQHRFINCTAIECSTSFGSVGLGVVQPAAVGGAFIGCSAVSPTGGGSVAFGSMSGGAAEGTLSFTSSADFTDCYSEVSTAFGSHDDEDGGFSMSVSGTCQRCTATSDGSFGSNLSTDGSSSFTVGPFTAIDCVGGDWSFFYLEPTGVGSWSNIKLTRCSVGFEGFFTSSAFSSANAVTVDAEDIYVEGAVLAEITGRLTRVTIDASGVVGDVPAVLIGDGTTVEWCKLLTNTDDNPDAISSSGTINAKIYHCALNHGISPGITNLISTPYNVQDVSLT